MSVSVIRGSYLTICRLPGTRRCTLPAFMFGIILQYDLDRISMLFFRREIIGSRLKSCKRSQRGTLGPPSQLHVDTRPLSAARVNGPKVNKRSSGAEGEETA